MNFLPLIESKRNGGSLVAAQIQEAVAAYTSGKIPDYQMAAFLMAVYFRGLTNDETRALTLAMRDSGEVLRFPADPRPVVDKHSTGGIGDKVSLPLAPLLACLGFRVPMISGRGLGITGGTLDKLESIPGFTTQLAPERIVAQVQQLGVAFAGQTATMIPADKKIYALRDATATVESIPLITASILSKKLAESLDALVMDVKFGAAAFMPTLDKARELARSIVTLANDCGVKTRALLTNMNTPLGRSAGNWLEVKESVSVLEVGKAAPRRAELRESQSSPLLQKPMGTRVARPSESVPADLLELVVECAASLLVQTGKAGSLETARQQAADCLDSGAPLRKWEELLAAQGADLDAYHRKLALDHTAPVVMEFKAQASGFVTRCDARVIGEIVRDLGGGRMTKESVIHHEVGIDHLAKPGERVATGGVLARIHARTQGEAEAAGARLKDVFEISDEPLAQSPLICEVIE